ncbi:hypothetical protein OUZ56_003516 [Daphnia magna]|uniref:Uncharacterized protein n=1 Tax=Daphnia magna TaxID=35525 RepID=A0ABR0A8X9_9CRUS|nr:hypothetical protein OUZ56_003516 [Daphnia magna]
MLKERASLLKTSQVRLKSVRDGLVARLCSRPSLLKVVLGLRTTPSQDFGVNLNCVCLDFGFSSRIPLMAKCVFVLPTPPSAYSPPPSSPTPTFCLDSISVDLTSSYSLGFLRYVPLPSPIEFKLFPKENVNHDTKHFEGLYSFLPCYIPTLAGFRIYMISSLFISLSFPSSFSLYFYLAISSTFRTEQLD